MRLMIAASATLLGLSAVLAADGASTGEGANAGSGGSTGAAETAWDFSFTSIDGKPMPLSDFRGKVLLVVNTASFCGYTGQYEDLQKLWRRYREKGFVILGVPANDFGAQEPGSNEKIKAFCEANYGVDFPLLEKQTVLGAKAHPLYTWAAARTGPEGVPRWNFHKLLIGRDGALIGWFSTPTPPLDGKITSAVEKALAPPAN
jgi:glutathione peroxidase